jgi:hypothetical protein
VLTLNDILIPHFSKLPGVTRGPFGPKRGQASLMPAIVRNFLNMDLGCIPKKGATSKSEIARRPGKLCPWRGTICRVTRQILLLPARKTRGFYSNARFCFNHRKVRANQIHGNGAWLV